MMIKSFNRRQTLRAMMSLVLAMIALAAAFLFFWWATRFANASFKLKLSSVVLTAIPIGLTTIVVVTGLLTWRRGKGHTEMAESDLALPTFDESTGGAYAVGYYARQVTGPAYLLSQIFLAAPLQFGNAIDCINSRIPDDEELERRLQATLAFARKQKGWHGISEYAGKEQEVSYLIRMRKLLYGSKRGRVKLNDGI